MKQRRSGILLHITSLPSIYGIGDLGPWAYRFADFLAETKQSLWQVLPFNPIETSHGNSPYHNTSAFANNIMLISPEIMIRDGLLDESEVLPLPEFPEQSVDYDTVFDFKNRIFDSAFLRFKKKKDNFHYQQFCAENADWLEDFALFQALKDRNEGKAWCEWPHEERSRQPDTIELLKKELGEKIGREKFLQYEFVRQWAVLKRYCNLKNIHIFGDMPIYVDFDSPDVWAHPELFKLDHEKRPYAVAGVPPDYFSSTGQLWGNPLYNWDVLRERGYDWWISRMEHNLALFDLVRIDHFRGLVAYWEVPAHEQTAINGRWVEAPVTDFLNRLNRRFPILPIIAEDLGIITPDVREVMRNFEFPGMKILLFAFNEDFPMHPYLPHTYEKNFVAYTGTHDNNITRGWFHREARQQDRERLFRYIGREFGEEDVHREMMRLAMGSVANMVVVPMQDVLGLGEDSRMNLPGTATGNWKWRLIPSQLTSSITNDLRELTITYGRA